MVLKHHLGVGCLVFRGKIELLFDKFVFLVLHLWYPVYHWDLCGNGADVVKLNVVTFQPFNVLQGANYIISGEIDFKWSAVVDGPGPGSWAGSSRVRR